MYDFLILRELRKRQGLTIGDVSDRSGISPAVISKLERNISIAELDTLFKLARVFGMTAADLISLAESKTGQKVLSDQYTSNGFSFQRVRYHNVRCMYGPGKAGEHLARPEVHQDHYELCWVLKGEIHISLPNERHCLKEGESLQFDAVLEHSYDVITDCEILIIHIAKGKKF
jgi:transcriptional regulator with XRE-family HTH domain